MRIYFAAPLFSNAEKKFNETLAERLEKVGFQVFLPQRDGVEKDKSQYSKMAKEERRITMFNLDRDEILKADVFLFILDGRIPDEGACVELGMAYSQKYLAGTKKLLIGLQTDSRAAFVGSKLNPMVGVPLNYIADEEEDLISYLNNYISK